MKSTTEGVAMTEAKQKNEPNPATRFRKMVTGGSYLLVSYEIGRFWLAEGGEA